MKCCGNNKNGDNKKHNPLKHMLMMVLCCGLPFLIISALSYVNVGEGYKTAVAGIGSFICPLMMMFMMFMMFKKMKNGGCCSNKKEVDND